MKYLPGALVGEIDMTVQGQLEDPEFRDIGHGLLIPLVNGAIPHWNVAVPGLWQGSLKVSEVGSYIHRHCSPKPGIYRLIGLDDAGKPASLTRMCGCDQTGTLYIGREGKNFAVGSRPSKLVRSLREPRGRGSVFNYEHDAGCRLRTHKLLSERFPLTKLAIDICYSDESKVAERTLLDFYFDCFGDRPPLNFN